MSIVLFLIFAFSDLFMTLICTFTYKNAFSYKSGMVCGVHLKKEYATLPEVERISLKYEKLLKNFNIINIFLSVICCAPMLFNFENAGLFIWTVWLILYLIFLNYLLIKPFRLIYDMKVKNGWVDEAKKRMISVDTVSSAYLESKIKPQYHIYMIIAAAIIYLTAFLKARDSYLFTSLNIFTVITITLSLTYLLATFFIKRSKNDVKSSDSDINIKINLIRKGGWEKGLLYADLLNIISFFVIILIVSKTGFVYNFAFVLYMFLQFLSVFLLIFFVLKASNERNNYEMIKDLNDFYVDDDEYWYSGFYNNPNDSQLFVASRFSSSNVTVNLARPAGKVLSLITGIITFLSFLLLLTLPFYLSNMKIETSFNEEYFVIDGGLYTDKLSLSDIESVSLLNDFPDDTFIRENGISTSKFSVGRFSGHETGRCHLYIYNDEDKVIKIKAKDSLIFLNASDDEKTTLIFNDLNERL